jgi:RIO kinase 2
MVIYCMFCFFLYVAEIFHLFVSWFVRSLMGSAHVSELRHPEKIFHKLMKLILRLAEYGLIHSDFNEFNLLINDEEEITLIDFPQMVSTSHINAEFYFNRDVECIRVFFSRRFHFNAESVPSFTKDTEKKFSLDLEIEASGYHKENEKELERLLNDLKEDEENAKRKREEGTDFVDEDDDSENDESAENSDEEPEEFEEQTEQQKEQIENELKKQEIKTNETKKRENESTEISPNIPTVEEKKELLKEINKKVLKSTTEKFVSIPQDKQIDAEELNELPKNEENIEKKSHQTQPQQQENEEEQNVNQEEDSKSITSERSTLSQIDYDDVKKKVKRSLTKKYAQKPEIRKKTSGGKNQFKHSNKNLKEDFNSF